MTRFWLVRHGPTHERAFTGWRDVPADLSDRAALDRLANFLPADALVTSSDLSRSTATADAIAGGRRRLPPWDAFREFDFGAWDGLTFAQVDAADSALCRRFWEDPGDIAPPGGESWNAVAARVRAAMAALAQDYHGAEIVVVGHMGMIMTAIAKCGGTPYQALGHRIDNLSVTDITIDLPIWRIGAINRIV